MERMGEEAMSHDFTRVSGPGRHLAERHEHSRGGRDDARWRNGT